jgi:hypothetical protein
MTSTKQERSILGLEKRQDVLASNPPNTICADCQESNPEWASMGFGIFICLKCAGFHRSLGAHLTTVRSLTLDEWTVEQVQVLEISGNQPFIEYVQDKVGLEKYHQPNVLYYRYDFSCFLFLYNNTSYYI